ncbi:MAG TPA: glycosyltransferase 87 family protein [Gaiellaceae bacterium]
MTKSARIPVAGACLLFLACCSLPWVGLWNPNGVADTGLYSLYGGRMAHGLVPYRDFFIEFPPGALPALVIPALPRSNYVVWFKVFEFLCGAGTLVCLGIILAGLRVSRRNTWIALGLAAIAPAVLGAITLNSFDYWPALLTTAAVAALVSRRTTIAFALLGAATAAKLFPAGLLPLALLFAVPQLGRWRRPLIAYACTLLLIVAPFAILGPGGLRFSLDVQLRRGLQLESLGASILATAHHFGLYDAHYAPNLAYAQLSGTTASALATVSTVVMVAAIALVALLYHRTRGEASDLVNAAAATIVAIVAFAKVISPQYLLWLVALVAAAALRRRLAGPLLLGVLGLTQVWVPGRFRELQSLEWVTWALLARNLLLVTLFAVLATGLRDRAASDERASSRTLPPPARRAARRAIFRRPDRTA